MAGPWDNMNPEFSSRVQALIAASGGRIRPGSGFRTVEEQIALRKKNGCPDVWTAPASSCRVPTAIPGRSNHNHGLAMDLQYSGDGAAWAAKNAARFGLHFPVRGENWHVEMIDDDGSRGHMQGAMRRGALGFDLRWQDEDRKPVHELEDRLNMIGQILGASAPEMPTPEQMPSPENPLQQETPMDEGGMRTDETTIGGGPQGAPMSTGGGGDIKSMVRNMAAQMGWGEDQWPALERLVQKESSWNPRADNPTSSAYGLFQFLTQTWKNYGASQTDDPAAQAQLGLRYIKDRYGSPSAALAFHNRKGWY